MATDAIAIKEQVRQRYGGIARSVRESVNSPTSCCSPEGDLNEITFFDNLYTATELTGLPETVTEASLGCGNPHAIAGLQPGETVLDLGSGGGIDCFLAAQQIGPAGHVIGLDMTPDMLALANENKAKVGIQNVEFRQGEIENMPIDDEAVDVIISNCVINLSPDKDAVFSEAFRVLKPGGRLAVSDIVTHGDIPDAVRQSIESWVGCIAGALDEEVYLQKIREAGFTDVRVESRDLYGTEMLDSQMLGPAAEALLATIDPATVQGYAAVSAKIVAYKPR